MKKHLLVGAALLGAMGLSTANALEVDNIATVGGVDITSTPYPLAEEVDVSLLSGDELIVELAPSTGTLPSGNLFVNITLANGTFDGALNGNTVFPGQGNCNPVATINQGGADGASTVRFAVSGLDTCTAGADGILVNVPFNATGGDVTATYLVTLTDGTTQLDGGALNVAAVTEVDAFSASFTPAVSGPVADVNAPGSAYLQFVGPTLSGLVGELEVAVAPTAYSDISGTAATSADIDAVEVSLAGNFAAFDSPLPGSINTATAVGDITPTTADFVFNLAGAGDDGTIAEAIAGAPFTVTADNLTPISATDISASALLILNPAIYEAQAPEGGTLASISRNGSSETLPWTASATQAAGTGSTTYLRVSNPTTSPFGAISARVLSSSLNPALAGTEGELWPSLAAGGEQVFTSADIEAAVGNFGRGDIEIVVEGEGAFITRLIQRADGSTVEINNRD